MATKTRGGTAQQFSYALTSSGGNSATGSYSSPGSIETIVYSETVDYYKRKRRGELLPVNLCTNSKYFYEDFQPGTRSSTAQGSGVPEHWNGSWRWAGNPITDEGTVPYELSPIDPEDYHYLVTTALAQAKADAWDVLTFLAELKETMQMISTAAPRLARVVNDVVNKARRTKAPLDTIQDLWLEARYGWRPLIGDINDAMEAYERFSSKYRRSRGYASHEINDANAVSYTPAASSVWDIVPHWLVTCTRNVQVRGFAALDMVPNSQAIGFDPFVTGYELLPYSFVLDWVANVGDTIAAMSPSLLVKGQVTGFSIKEETVHTSVNTGFAVGANQTLHSTDVPERKVRREVYHRYPVAAPALPSFRLNVDMLKFIDGVFLLRGLKQRSLSRLFN